MLFLKNHVGKIKIKDVNDNQLYAPISGQLIPLEQVEDAVFSQKIMGDGIAVEPEEGALYAPVKGKISVVFPTGHVIGIEAENGANIIMHVGIDTVEMQGKGFDVRVKKGDAVNPGDLLARLDLPLIRKKHAATTMVVIENSGEFQLAPTKQEQIKAGEALMKVTRIV